MFVVSLNVAACRKELGPPVHGFYGDWASLTSAAS